MELIGRTTATIMHEMRNPLTVIKGYAELIARDSTATEDRRLKGLLQAIGRLSAVMNCVLSIARTPEHSQKTADLAQSLAQVREFLLMSQRPRPVVNTEIPDGLPPAHIPSTDLEEVLLNLLINACDATKPTPEMTVSVSLEPDGPPAPSWGPFVASTTSQDEWSRQWPHGTPAIMIRIRDRGPGITPELLRLLFHEQITTKQQNCGTGLGMLLCRDLLRASNGTLVIESMFGFGTTATVILPTHLSVSWMSDKERVSSKAYSIPLIE